jgi:excisionase family DNA binding protein
MKTVTEESEPRRRFLTVEQVSEELNVGVPQIRALLRGGELKAIQVGGRGYLAQSHGSMPFLPGVHGQTA